MLGRLDDLTLAFGTILTMEGELLAALETAVLAQVLGGITARAATTHAAGRACPLGLGTEARGCVGRWLQAAERKCGAAGRGAETADPGR